MFCCNARLLHRCVSYGVLPYNEAEKIFQVVAKRKKQQRGGASSPAVAPAAAKKKKAKLVKEEEGDPDMAISGEERIGSGMI